MERITILRAGLGEAWHGEAGLGTAWQGQQGEIPALC